MNYINTYVLKLQHVENKFSAINRSILLNEVLARTLTVPKADQMKEKSLLVISSMGVQVIIGYF